MNSTKLMQSRFYMRLNLPQLSSKIMSHNGNFGGGTGILHSIQFRNNKCAIQHSKIYQVT